MKLVKTFSYRLFIFLLTVLLPIKYAIVCLTKKLQRRRCNRKKQRAGMKRRMGDETYEQENGNDIAGTDDGGDLRYRMHRLFECVPLQRFERDVNRGGYEHFVWAFRYFFRSNYADSFGLTPYPKLTIITMKKLENYAQIWKVKKIHEVL